MLTNGVDEFCIIKSDLVDETGQCESNAEMETGKLNLLKRTLT